MHVGMWMIWLACSAKQEEPDLLIPPVGYDVNTVVEAEGFKLCVETQPTNSSIRVSSREVSDCLTVKGEVFVEVDADGFIPYRELLQVDADLTHQVMLVPKPSEGAAIDYPMPQKDSAPTSFIAPSRPIELCVNVTPADAFLRINGVKRPVVRVHRCKMLPKYASRPMVMNLTRTCCRFHRNKSLHIPSRLS